MGLQNGDFKPKAARWAVRALEKIKIRALLVFSAVFSAVTPVT
jgi:hypothetical protein